jgi:hypothetical protein
MPERNSPNLDLAMWTDLDLIQRADSIDEAIEIIRKGF